MEAYSLQHDLDAVFNSLKSDWRDLGSARIFMTGGTGLIGRWMLEALTDAQRRLRLDVEVTVLTRDPHAFALKAPHLAANPALRFIAGDILETELSGSSFTHVIHAATDASAELNETDPRRMFDTIVNGTRRTLDLAVACRAKRYFFLSSGAVYGAQAWDITHVAEDWAGGPDPLNPRNAYAEGKRAAEMLCGIYSKQFGLDVVNARIFALLGPMLSLGIHFAAGNFILDAMAKRPIRVQSAGTAVRSYLYIADLVVWLWSILLRAEPGAAYNCGSEHAVSIADLAERINTVLGGAGHEVLGRDDIGWNPGRYVPSTAKIRRDLGLAETVDLDEAIRRTAHWNGWKQ